MSNLPTPKELHDRAGDAARETRGTMIKLTTGALGLLIFVATRSIEPALTLVEKISIVASILFVVCSLGFAVWFGFAEAQWSYWWGVEVDPEHKDRNQGRLNKLKWHGRKALAEKAMLVMFVVAAASIGAFILLRIFHVGT